MITLERASRWYGQVIGLNDVTCTIPAGLTALLGPNGAGKSTLLRLITGQLRPTTGTVRVLDEAPFANARVLKQLGYCPDIDSFYEEMTGREFVTQMASLSGIAPGILRDKVQATLERVGMADRCDRKIAGYSKGMRQRIKVAQGIIHDPKILILDEPLNGLDPVGRRDMSELMLSLADAGCCVLLSSHILYEVEQLTNRILLIHRGRLLAQGSVGGIRDMMDRHPHRVQITATDRARELGRALLGLDSVMGIRFDAKDGRRFEAETGMPERFYTDFARVVLDGGFTVERFQSPDNNLETVMRYLLGDSGSGKPNEAGS